LIIALIVALIIVRFTIVVIVVLVLVLILVVVVPAVLLMRIVGICVVVATESMLAKAGSLSEAHFTYDSS